MESGAQTRIHVSGTTKRFSVASQRSSALRGSRRDESENAGVLKQRSVLTRRADFEARKKPADRNFAQVLPDIGRVVPWNVVEPGPAGNAIKIQTERWRGYQPGFQILKRLFKIVAGSLRIAQHQPDRVALLRMMCHRERAVFLAGPDDVTDQEFSALDFAGRGIHGHGEKHERKRAPQIGRQRPRRFRKYLISRAAIELQDHIVAHGS